MRLSQFGVLVALATASQAQIASYCPTDGVCYKVNVPDASASSGDGNLYFQIQGPSSLQWIGLGQGKSMSGSNMFIVYADSRGSNVTLSPRLGRGNFQPDLDNQAQVSLLDGSGIANGKMIANVRCSNCASWSGGSMDFSSSSSDWIWAIKDGSALSSDSQSANLQQHSEYDSFHFDLTVARGGSSLNPFVSTASTQTAAGGAVSTSGLSAGSPQETSTGYHGGFTGGSGDGAGGAAGAYTSIAANFSKRNRAVIAHGTLMGLAFALLFPSGSLFIRLFSFPGLVWVHAALQVFTYALAIAGLGLGVYIAVWPSQVNYIGNHHPIIGITVIGLLLFQPILGLVHHFIYKSRHIRTFWATAHVWYGRVVITLGIINGGLGLRLSGNTVKGEIAYGVIAGVMWAVWMAVAALSYFRRHSDRRGVAETGGKAAGGISPSHGSQGSQETRYWREERDGEGARIKEQRFA